MKWGPALLPAPNAPSEGYAGVRNLVHLNPKAQPYPLSILAHQLRRRFPPNSSLLRGARSIYQTARPEGSLVFRPFRPGVWNRSPSKPKPSNVLRPFLGNPLSRPASLTRSHKETQEPRRATGRFLFRRLFPTGSVQTRRLFPILPAEIGPLVTCRALHRCRLRGGRDRRPDHSVTMHSSSESRKRKIRLSGCG